MLHCSRLRGIVRRPRRYLTTTAATAERVAGLETPQRRGRMIETPPGVVFSPESIVKRQSHSWRGMAAETVQLSRLEPFEYRRRAPWPPLAAPNPAGHR